MMYRIRERLADVAYLMFWGVKGQLVTGDPVIVGRNIGQWPNGRPA